MQEPGYRTIAYRCVIRMSCTSYVVFKTTKYVRDVVSVVSGGENGGQEGRTTYGRIFILNRDPLDHRYQTA